MRKSRLTESQIIGEERGAQSAIVVYSGSEFTSRALDQWSYRTGVRLDLAEPGKPIQLGVVGLAFWRFALSLAFLIPLVPTP